MYSGYGGGFGLDAFRRGSGAGAADGGSRYDDYFGGYYGGGGFGGGLGIDDRKEPSDDCARVEANGVALADVLREAVEDLSGGGSFVGAPEQVVELVRFFTNEDKEQRRFLLGHCPQAVVLAVLLQAELEAAAAGNPEALLQGTVASLSELLKLAPSLRSPYKVPPVWTGKPWGEILNAAQRRTGVVLFPVGEQQFHVDFVPAANWSIWANRRCKGRRDLGNLQGTPLATCLEKCSSHPSCRSATFWHWQPGGMGFEQRCFLSSSCTSALSTDEGAEGAVLFEKLAVLSKEEQQILSDVVRTSGASWAPRAGHKLLASAPPGAPMRLWLLGGVGVDPFTNTSAGPSPPATEKDDGLKEKKSGKKGKGSDTSKPSLSERASRRRTNVTTQLNVVEAYLSRHVELSGELPPLRSLPYGRLGDVWWSDDAGANWQMKWASTPWGARAFFGAVALKEGRGLLVLGGVRTPEAKSTEGDLRHIAREYVNDVWLADLTASDISWQELPNAGWEPRAAFQALSWKRSPEEVLVLGGRLQNGNLQNDVWTLALSSDFQGAWRQVTAAAAWSPRSDFAAAADQRIWLLGGCDQDGRALSDVWLSDDGKTWQQVQAAAPWGPRLGAAAVAFLDSHVILYGGYSYPDSGFDSLSLESVSGPAASPQATAAWASADGVQWQPVDPDRLTWTRGSMYAAATAAPCQGAGGGVCAYVSGGMNHEGYYENFVQRLKAPKGLPVAEKTANSSAGSSGVALSESGQWDGAPLRNLHVGVAACVMGAVVVSITLCCCCCGQSNKNAEPALSCLRRLLAGTLLLILVLGSLAATALWQLSVELQELRTGAVQCHVDDQMVSTLWDAMGLTKAAERWDQFEMLLRLASREPQLGYGGFGGYGSYGDSMRGGKLGDAYGSYGRGQDSYGGFGSYGSPYGDDLYGAPQPSAKEELSPEAQLKKELSLLPTTQGLSCRTPKCDRNATTCALSTSRSLTTPYGCCSDYMLLMITDVTDWLAKQEIPYFITYGTLLGAARQNDILPWTQDMDIVVDRSYWPRLQRGLEAAEFFGGRRYLFGVDQWEERVSRVCADWEGFATSIIGAQDNDRFTRPTDFHLDVYASDWWQITDMHLVDCVEPLGVTHLQIRGRNFSAPARPRACLEKLYGAEWRIPKHALSGVN
eukprot:TRINITY_DN80097_c0_g1_i1.p1 TRINITY_DN80097_c0_g1~~TRINITY_DN80097_c0_g1_i1.p1  ORF type:complete len:1213 (+),score=251.50 TRINITY_DN80097_c0_g1_i1:167-3640(+)